MHEGCTIDIIGELRLDNGERRLRFGTELARLFHRYSAAIRRTLEIADRRAFGWTTFATATPTRRSAATAQARLERIASYTRRKWSIPGIKWLTQSAWRGGEDRVPPRDTAKISGICPCMRRNEDGFLNGKQDPACQDRTGGLRPCPAPMARAGRL